MVPPAVVLGPASGFARRRRAGSRRIERCGWPGRYGWTGNGTVGSGPPTSRRSRRGRAIGPCRRRRTCSTSWPSMSGGGTLGSCCIGRGSRWTGRRSATSGARRASAGIDGVRYHDLRHAFASTLISAGCPVKAVSRALGHASAATTLNLYSRPWPGDEDRIRDAVDLAPAPRAEDRLRAEGERWGCLPRSDGWRSRDFSAWWRSGCAARGARAPAAPARPPARGSSGPTPARGGGTSSRA